MVRKRCSWYHVKFKQKKKAKNRGKQKKKDEEYDFNYLEWHVVTGDDTRGNLWCDNINIGRQFSIQSYMQSCLVIDRRFYINQR